MPEQQCVGWKSYRQKGDLLQGVKLPGGGILRIEKNFVQVELPQDIPDDKPDNRILKVCKGACRNRKRGTGHTGHKGYCITPESTDTGNQG